jgi:hypothetical protein
MSNPIYQDWLRRFREDLRSGDMDRLEDNVNQAGLEVMLDPDFLALARQMDARQVVILIATLGISNADETSVYERLLASYQCLQGQLSVDEAAEQCAQAVQGPVAFYRTLLGSLAQAAPPPDIVGIQTRVDDLRFGIELLADANRAVVITPLLKAWQRIDPSDMPWLRACRALVSRAKNVRAASEAAQLALATQQRLDDAPRGQEAVKQEMRIQWANLALKSRNGALALKAAEVAFAHDAQPERRFTIAKALMMKGDLAQALAHTDVLLREMAVDPKAQEVAENQVHYSFEVAAAEDTLLTLNRILRGAGLRPFLMSGTLLGYAREGALLAHDKDIDLGLLGWEDQFTVAQALIQAGHFDLDLTQLTGQNRFLLSAHDLRNGMAVDFFFFHDRGDHFLHGIDFDFGFTQNFKFSKFKLRDVEFLGETFSVPDDVDTNLRENYGDWKTPAKSYVVTVESPGLSDENLLARNVLAHLELMKTMAKGLDSERVRRVLAAIDAQNLHFLSSPTRAAVDAWLQERIQHVA